MDDGTWKTYLELRQDKYNSILDEVVFIARASEGAITIDWIMNQPISIRKKYLESLSKEIKEREPALKSK